MVALTLACTACASAPAPIPTPAPEAPEPTTAQLSLSGLPDITLPHSSRTATLREALALVEATRAREPNVWAPPEERQARRDADAQATLDVENIVASLGNSVEAQAARVLLALLREQFVYRESRSHPPSESQHADRDHALEACVALGASDARLAPWTQRCGALTTYWQAYAARAARPFWDRAWVWPEGCPASADHPWQSSNEVSLGRPALALHVSSDLSPRDEARVAAAVGRALLARMPNAEVIPEAELQAAEQAFVAMRGLDGQACAAPPSVDARLAHTHPELWSVSIDARCRRDYGTRRCALLVQSFARATAAFGRLEASVESPTVAGFEEAASHLHEQHEERPSRCFWSSGHVAPENMCGESASLENSDIDAALGPIRDAVQACRDTDVAPASHFRVRLDVRGDGHVREVDIAHVAGPRRIACLTRAFRDARFPAAQMPVVVTVYGWFEANNTGWVPVRSRVGDDNRDAFEPRVRDRLRACVAPDSPVHVIDGTLHIAANGLASRVDGDATDATSVCIRNALVGSTWSCAGERDVPMRLCIGNPVRATEPVRP